jgi:hypothetical protein
MSRDHPLFVFAKNLKPVLYIIKKILKNTRGAESTALQNAVGSNGEKSLKSVHDNMQ